MRSGPIASTVHPSNFSRSETHSTRGGWPRSTSACLRSTERKIPTSVRFGSFAAGVSYISILTGTFQLFYFGFGTDGPAYLWSWPLVLIGQLAVALCFMELAAKYPIAGSVYNWSKLLGSRIVGWS